MCRRSLLKAVWILVLLALSAAACRSLAAEQVRYGWSGTLVPIDERDPWEIGPDGAAFYLQVDVSRRATDLSEVNVEFAAYAASNAKLVIDGDDLTFVGPGLIDFTDNHAGLFDVATFAGDFERFGQVVEFGTVVALPLDTYEFRDVIVFPFVYDPTFNLVKATCCGRVYAAIVPQGALVTAVSVVPEPSLEAMLAALVASMLVASRMSWMRSPSSPGCRKSARPLSTAFRRI